MSAGTETKLVAYEPSAYNTVPGTPAGAYIYCRSHDLSGNVTQRVEGPLTWDFTYDGDDHQRRAVSPSGNEEL